MIECCRENVWYKKKRRKKSKKIRLFFFLLIFTGIFLYYRFLITDTVSRICVDYTYSYATESVNKAVLDSFLGMINYSNFVVVEKNTNGEIVLMTTNSVEVNKINREISEKTQKNLQNRLNNGIPVPILAFSGIKILSGFGKTINYRALSIVSVDSNFSSTFESVGINQTLHSIYVNVICKINVHFPLYVKNQTTSTKILISEAVLVGKVPDVYLNGGLFS